MKDNLSYITERKKAEKALDENAARERQHGCDMAFLSRSAMAFFELPPDGDIYQLIINLLSDRLRNDAVLAVGDYDENADVFRPRAIHGMENMLGAIKKVLGRDPMELSGRFGPATKKALATGRLTKVDRGLRDFSSNLLSARIVHGVEKILGLTDFYVVGFTKGGITLGGLSIILPKHAALPDPQVMEAFAGQAAVALERWTAQEALRKECSFRDSVIKRAAEGLCVCHAIPDYPHVAFTVWNDRMTEITGYTMDEINRLGWYQTMYPDRDVQKRAIERMARMRKGDDILAEEWTITRADGEKRTLSISTSILDTANGDTHVLAMMQDITGRKRTEEELRNSEERLKLLFEYAPDAYYLNDLKGHFVDGNKEAERTLGYKKEELIGKSFLSLKILSPSQLPKAAALLAKNAMGKSTGPDEFILHRKDGSQVIAEIRTYPIKINAQTLVLGIARDITERKQAEEEQRQQDKKFRAFVETTNEWIWSIDMEGKHTFCNPALETILGYSPEEFVGKDSLEYICEEDRPKVQKMLKQKNSKKEGWSGLVLRWRHKDGSIRFLESTAVPIFDQAGELVGYRGADRDITERMRAEESLRQSMTQLRATLKASINALASAIEMRDPYTTGHQERVTKLASAIAREMGLSEDQIECIQVAGIIHDIGKIYVPAEILSKPGKLSEFEFMIVKTHSQVGYKILGKIEFPWPIADIVHQHHERVNGSGYPQRLIGKDILLEAKILGVADVVEAMSSHRPYRPALGIPVALEEISRNKGVLYDAEVADACLKLFAENKFKFE